MRGMWGEREDEGKEDIAQDVYLEAFPPQSKHPFFLQPINVLRSFAHSNLHARGIARELFIERRTEKKERKRPSLAENDPVTQSRRNKKKGEKTFVRTQKTKKRDCHS